MAADSSDDRKASKRVVKKAIAERAMLERCEKFLDGVGVRMESWADSPPGVPAEMRTAMFAQAAKCREGAEKIRKLLNGELVE